MDRINGPYTWSLSGNSQQTIASYGTCAFGVQGAFVGNYDVSNDDVILLIYNSINEYSCTGAGCQIGSKGSMICGSQVVAWGLYWMGTTDDVVANQTFKALRLFLLFFISLHCGRAISTRWGRLHFSTKYLENKFGSYNTSLSEYWQPSWLDQCWLEMALFDKFIVRMSSLLSFSDGNWSTYFSDIQWPWLPPPWPTSTVLPPAAFYRTAKRTWPHTSIL